MNNTYAAPGGTAAWRFLMGNILDDGADVAPRGQPTKEILHRNQLVVDMARAVVTDRLRKLNYKFMCAEALWMLAGDNRLAPLQRFIKDYGKFSDDGETLAGAYGPHITAQIPYVVNTLVSDRDSRQATLTIWSPCPRPSKDIPCTVAMTFSIREDRLHQHAYMRSSDAWLGIPYDMFSFACVGLRVACLYNDSIPTSVSPVLPGQLTISATSSHLYERNIADVRLVLSSDPTPPIEPVPDGLVLNGDWPAILEDLHRQREGEAATMWKVTP